jgi:hypothetical protein
MWCVKKWSKSHRCGALVQLHVVQEMLELFGIEGDEQLSVASKQHDHLFVAISKEAVNGLEGPRAMHLSGVIQGHSVQILVDSGSTHTFICQKLAASLSTTPQHSDVKVQIANGGFLQCSGVLKQTQ